jgi:hypothetical protein
MTTLLSRSEMSRPAVSSSGPLGLKLVRKASASKRRRHEVHLERRRRRNERVDQPILARVGLVPPHRHVHREVEVVRDVLADAVGVVVGAFKLVDVPFRVASTMPPRLL